MTHTMMHATELETAVQECNDGIDYLLNRNFRQAVAALSASLRRAKQLLNDHDLQLSVPECDTLPHMRSTVLDQCMSASSQRGMGHNVAADQHGKDSSFIYHQAIRFLPNTIPTQGTANDIYNASVVLSTIVVFNLALTYQLSAYGCAAKLNKAVRLYELAISFQSAEQLTDSVIFTMATLNNLGLVHRQLGNQAASKACFQQLLSAVMLVVDYERGENRAIETPCAAHFMLEGFLNNTSSVLSKPRTAPAA